jgi:cytochrome c peroxidase
MGTLARVVLCLAIGLAPAAAQAVISPYPPVSAPAANPITPQKAVLGKILFWDEQLSSDNTIACGSCHRPTAGGTDSRSFMAASQSAGPDGIFGTADDQRGSMGVIRCNPDGSLIDDGVFFPDAQVTPRMAPSFLDAMFSSTLFWDGRAGGAFVDPDTGTNVITGGGALENLSTQPLLNTIEMGCITRTLLQVHTKLAAITPLRLASNLPVDVANALNVNPTYPALFNAAFGSSVINSRRIAFAIATYLRTLTSNQTPYDQFIAGSTGALTYSEQNGLQTMRNRQCTACHVEPLFSDFNFFNNGLSNPQLDTGRQQVTNLPADLGKMKVPSLRNVGLREPFGLLHAGHFTTLDAVVAAYNMGGLFAQNRDPNILPLALSQQQMQDVVDFLRTGLTDPRVTAQQPPFDRPTLGSESPGLLPVIGGSGAPGGGGSVPRVVAAQPPLIGQPFTIGVAGGTPPATAILALNTFAALPGTTVAGVPIYIAIDPLPLMATIILQGPVGFGNGFGSVTFQIPQLAALSGIQIIGQWFILDPFAPTGFAATPGVELTII